MQARTRLILIASGTFLAGALTGATIASTLLDETPPADVQPTRPVEDAPAVTKQSAEDEPIGVISAVTAPPVDQTVTETNEPAPATDSAGATDEPTAETIALIARVEELTDGWGRMQAELAQLRERVARVERREPDPAESESSGTGQTRPSTPEEQREALLRVGVTPEAAEDIIWRRSQLSLARLDLRDEAAREGWLSTARYREELRSLNEQRTSIEDEIGPDAYDRYLFETGQPNRVAVDSVLPGSAADETGLQPGDVIERYGDVKVLSFDDLRGATSSGARGELVPVSLVRGGERIEVWLPRGPIGIGLDSTRADPSR